MAYKVFTNGSVLNASELNENLMQQSIAVFSNAAARTAAITSPVEGQMTWLEDVNRYEFYNGTAWQIESSGLVLVSDTSFSAASSVSVNNAFSSTFDSYKLLINVTSGSANPQRIGFRFRSGGTDNSATNYQYGNVYMGVANSLSIGGNNNVTEPSWPFFFTSGSRGGAIEATVIDPFLTATTKTFGTGTGAYLWLFGGMMTVTNSYDGFSFFPDTGNITGNVRVYGIRK